jgi:hypothetical protein
MSHEINTLSTIVVHNCPEDRDLTQPTTPNAINFGLVGLIQTSIEMSTHESWAASSWTGAPSVSRNA